MVLSFSRKFLPFEKVVLSAVYDALPSNLRQTFAVQVGCINKVQRILEWNEIEFYSMRWFKLDWPEEALFAERKEVCIATVDLQEPAAQTISVHAVGGHVFSLECPDSLKALRRVSAPAARNVRIASELSAWAA
jgi:hypothetical protein